MNHTLTVTELKTELRTEERRERIINAAIDSFEAELGARFLRVLKSPDYEVRSSLTLFAFELKALDALDEESREAQTHLRRSITMLEHPNLKEEP